MRETETTESMAASKLQALWNHPAGPKTSELTPPHLFCYSNQTVDFLFIYLCSRKSVLLLSLSLVVQRLNIRIHVLMPTHFTFLTVQSCFL